VRTHPFAAGDPILAAAIQGRDIKLDIPANATLTEIESTLGPTIEVYNRIDTAKEKIKPLIGAMLLKVQEHNLFKPEYKNITDYVERYVVGKLGLGRTTAFEALRTAKAWPSLTTEKYMRYGSVRLLLATKMGITQQSADWEKTLDSFTRLSTEELRKKAKGEAKPIEGTAEVVGEHTIAIKADDSLYTAWRNLLLASELSASDLFRDMVEYYGESLLNGQESGEAEEQPEEELAGVGG